MILMIYSMNDNLMGVVLGESGEGGIVGSIIGL